MILYASILFFVSMVFALPGCGPQESGFPSQSVRAGCWCSLANGTNACIDRTASGDALRHDIGNATHDWIEDANNTQYCTVNQQVGGYAMESVLSKLGCVTALGFCDSANRPNTACCDTKCTAPTDQCATFRMCNAPAATTTSTTAATTTTATTAGNTVDPTSATTQGDTTTATTKVDDTTATTKVGDTTATTKIDDTTATTQVGDTTATTKVGDTTATTQVGDTTATTTAAPGASGASNAIVGKTLSLLFIVASLMTILI